jgi:hypothetical protein
MCRADLQGGATYMIHPSRYIVNIMYSKSTCVVALEVALGCSVFETTSNEYLEMIILANMLELILLDQSGYATTMYHVSCIIVFF